MITVAEDSAATESRSDFLGPAPARLGEIDARLEERRFVKAADDVVR